MHRKPAGAARRVFAILLGATLVLGLTACGGGLEGPTPVTLGGTPSAATTDAAEEAKAVKAALAAYAGYMTAAQEASAIPDPSYSKLSKYLGDPLLTRVRLGIRELKNDGAVREGKLISEPTATVVDLDSFPKTVLIQDCVDGTGYKMVYKKTKKAVPGKQNVRYVATAKATLFPDAGWLINDGAAHQDQPC